MTLRRVGRIPDDVLELIGIPLTPNRMKCALLPLKVLVVGTAGLPQWEHIEDSALPE
jgi:nitrogen fixation protein NifU and related proteins